MNITNILLKLIRLFVFCTFNYLVINSGYTARLKNKVKKINKSIFEDVYFGDDTDFSYAKKSILYIDDDNLRGSELYSYGDQTEIESVQNQLKENTEDIDGIIVFKCECLMRALGIIKLFVDKFKFCGCFRLEGITQMVCIDNNILVVNMDTESG